MDRRILGAFVLGLLLASLVTLLGIYVVWQQYRVVDAGTSLAQAAKELDRFQTENEVLEGEYWSRRADQGLVRRAQTELEMVKPTRGETIEVTREEMQMLVTDEVIR